MQYEPRLSGFLKFQISGVVAHGRLIFAPGGSASNTTSKSYHERPPRFPFVAVPRQTRMDLRSTSDLCYCMR